ncbi:type II toxin-antitoxin system RelE/ParE family toxin [Listeria rocourtiae]|uniref:type II toxin-antitoxin system RelE/ParE family toxin n=1 Tax=Listeria rocourtiae TaxID=647910 RepID=UPI003D2F92AA
MEIYAKTQKMTKILSDERLLRKEYGKDIGDSLRLRVSEFKAAETLEDISHLKPQRLHQLKGNKYKDCYAVDLTKNFRCIFEAYDSDEERTLVKSEAVAIKIMEVGDYHGN